MERIEQIISKVNQLASALTRIQWEPFRQDAILEFSIAGNDKKPILLRLVGIHFFATRQSLLGGPVMDCPEERRVDFFGIFDDSPFIRQFIKGEIKYCGQVIVYDRHGRTIGESNFTKPLYINVNSSDGILDVVCENVEECFGIVT